MPLEPTRFSVFATLGAVLVAWLCGITLDRGPNLPSPIALIYAGAATLTPLGLGDQECQKSKKSCFLRSLPMVQLK
jgi:hypothetical protein